MANETFIIANVTAMYPKIADIACSDGLRIFQVRSPYWNNFHTPNLYCGVYDF